MHPLAVLFFAIVASAAAVPEPAQQIAQPGNPVKRAEATNGPLFISIDVITTTLAPTVTVAPALNAMRINQQDQESSSGCTPQSFCFDGITCGLRYGGCFDQNFCTGSTSFPIPTCTDDPSTGLTQNFQKRAEAAAAARAAEQ